MDEDITADPAAPRLRADRVRVAREALTALLLAASGLLIAVGVATFDRGAGLIAGGVLLVAWWVVVFGDIA